MRLIPLLLLLAGCPKPPAAAPESAADSPAPSEDDATPPAENGAHDTTPLTRPEPGEDFGARFTYEPGSTARVKQTLIEQSFIPGMVSNRSTIDGTYDFEVREEGDETVVRWAPDELGVRLEGPEEVTEPLARALERLLRIAPLVVLEPDGNVRDVILPNDEIDAARSEVMAMLEAAPELARGPIQAAADAMLDPASLSMAAEEGLAPWNVGEVDLAFQASEVRSNGAEELTFVGWVPCADNAPKERCGVLVSTRQSSPAEVERLREGLTASFADAPEESRPTVTDITIEEQYVFVLEPQTGRPRRVAHDKRTTAVLDLGEQGQLPYVKNLATAELWTWE